MVRANVLAAVVGLLVAMASVLAAGPGETPVLSSAASRKVHGAAGTFDLPLALTPANPTTEPRLGPAGLQGQTPYWRGLDYLNGLPPSPNDEAFADFVADWIQEGI